MSDSQSWTAAPVERYLSLGDLIARLEREDPDRVLPLGFANPHSYRGDYMDLAFEPVRDIPIADMLAAARFALGATFEGYKGGAYTMGEHTSCWIAEYGMDGDNQIGPLLLELLLGEKHTPPAVERCPRCGERLYSPAETETHNRTVHNFGPVGTVWAEAEPETRRPL